MKTKKILSVLLTILMVIGVMPISMLSASAESYSVNFTCSNISKTIDISVGDTVAVFILTADKTLDSVTSNVKKGILDDADFTGSIITGGAKLKFSITDAYVSSPSISVAAVITNSTGYAIMTNNFTLNEGVTTNCTFSAPSGLTSYPVVYDITNSTPMEDKDTNGGYITIDTETAETNDEVTVTVTPNDGYELDTLTYTPAGESAIDITYGKSFFMPEKAVTVSATFKESSPLFKEGAENTADNSIPDGWTSTYIVNVSSSAYVPFSNSTNCAHSGTKSLTLRDMTAGTVSYLCSPQLNFGSTSGEYSFRYWYYRPSGNGKKDEGLKVFVTPTPGDMNNAVEVIPFVNRSAGSEPIPATPGWNEYSGVINYTGLGYIMIVGYSQYGNTSFFDDLEVYKSNTYEISVESGIENGSVTVDPTTAAEGSTVTVTVTPDSNYYLAALTYTPDEGEETAITATEGKYSFAMPANNVTVNAVFAQYDTRMVISDGNEHALTEGKTYTCPDISGKSGPDCRGGVLFINKGSATGNGIAFVNNKSANGGAVYLYGSGGSAKLTLSGDTVFSNNTSKYDGGAIYIDSNGELVINGNTTFSNNTSENGGAIFNYGQLYFYAPVTFTGNSSSYSGGAISNGYADVIIADTVTLSTENDTFYSEGGSVTWDLTDTTTGKLVNYQYFTSANSALKLKVSATQAEGDYVIATGDFTSITDKDTFYITGVDGLDDVQISVNGDEVVYNGMRYSLAVNEDKDKLVLNAEKLYDVKVAEGITNGSVTVDPTSVKKDETVTVNVTPNEGYVLKSLSYTDGTTTTAIQKDGQGNYTFTMPANNVTVKAVFKNVNGVYYISSTGNDYTAVEDDETKPFATVQAAVNYIGSDSGTIKFLNDVTYAGEIIVSNAKNIIFDLNGYTYDFYGFFIEYNTVFTLKDSSNDKTGKLVCNYSYYSFGYAFWLTDNVKLNIESGNVFVKNSKKVYAIAAYRAAEITISGGTIDAETTGSNEAFAIYKEGTGKIDLTGGKLVSVGNGFVAGILNNGSGNITTENCTIDAETKGNNNAFGIDDYGTGTITVKDGSKIYAHSSTSGYSLAGIVADNTDIVIIEGGTVEANSLSSYAYSIWNYAAGTIKLNGGTLKATSSYSASGVNLYCGSVEINGTAFDCTTTSTSGYTACGVVSNGSSVTVKYIKGTFNLTASEKCAYNIVMAVGGNLDMTEATGTGLGGLYVGSESAYVKGDISEFDAEKSVITAGYFNDIGVNDYLTVNYKAVANNDATYTLKVVPTKVVTIDEEIENGTVSIGDIAYYAEGEKVTVTVTPDAGYELDTLTATYNDGEEKSLDTTDNKFTMPGYAVTVSATFKKTNETLFNEYKAELENDLDKLGNDSIVENAKIALSQLSFNGDKSLDENKADANSILVNAKKDLFNAYKEAKKAEFDKYAENYPEIVNEAKQNIDAIEYDGTTSLDDAKTSVDDAVKIANDEITEEKNSTMSLIKRIIKFVKTIVKTVKNFLASITATDEKYN